MWPPNHKYDQGTLTVTANDLEDGVNVIFTAGHDQFMTDAEAARQSRSMGRVTLPTTSRLPPVSSTGRAPCRRYSISARNVPVVGWRVGPGRRRAPFSFPGVAAFATGR